MRKIYGFYFSTPVVGFAAFQIAFFSLMWLSKSVHLLYFEQNNATENFGLSYSAMALAGYFSFLTGHLGDTYGVRKTLVAGALLYAAGMFLRIYPSSALVAVTSGLISGVGASLALSGLRIWMTTLVTSANTAQMVGVKTSTTAFGMAIGCFMMGAVPSIEKVALTVSYRQILLAASIGMAALSFIYFFRTSQKEIVASIGHKSAPFAGLRNLFCRHRRLAFITMVLGTMTGFYVSFISPYLPLIMKDKGLTLGAIGLSTGAFALIRFFADPWIARFVGAYREKSIAIYIASEVVVALVTAFFLWPISKWSFVGLLLFRSCALGMSAISEEVLWFRIFPKEQIGLFFGLSQSAFFLGDFIGGLLNGYLYKSQGLDICIEIVLVIMLANVALFFWLFQSQKAGGGNEASLDIAC